jgi:uncharacterized protein YndB with AHSA1/START domain
MRKRVETEARLDHPIERVFAYLADPLRWHVFAPAVVLRRQLDDGQPGLGTRWAAVDRVGPLKVRFVDELVAYEPGRHVAWQSSAPWNARTEYHCQPAGGSTMVRAIYDGDVDGWLKALSWAPTRLIAWFLARDLKRLDGVLTKERQAALHGDREPAVSSERVPPARA